ncbi:hypothetical protein WR25_24701 [Diploscapter pachys]|uniref:Uncharacterized protein n=1 Tax=Diploscapter pachys TaxID=2018661 RepID=A0A2A2L5F2_9BILA|nr:hypothetical protein WR25_24701 [Diploscapter pachys]
MVIIDTERCIWLWPLLEGADLRGRLKFSPAAVSFFLWRRFGVQKLVSCEKKRDIAEKEQKYLRRGQFIFLSRSADNQGTQRSCDYSTPRPVSGFSAPLLSSSSSTLPP